jgi:hypothetical protein
MSIRGSGGLEPYDVIWKSSDAVGAMRQNERPSIAVWKIELHARRM